MGKDKFVEGNARKKVPRPQPPHADRRLKRNRTRSAQDRYALEDSQIQEVRDSTPTLIILPCEICGRADGRHDDEDCFK